MTPQTIAEAIANARKIGTPTYLALVAEIEYLRKEHAALFEHVNYLKRQLIEGKGE
jgi:hypothetical protein